MIFKWTIRSVGEDVEKLELLCFTSGYVKWYSYYGNSLAVPQKVKHRITIWPSSSTPRHISGRIENICSHKSVYTNVHSNFIYNSQKEKATQMSISWGMDKQNVVYPYKGILFSHIKEWILLHATIWMNLRIISCVKEAIYKGHILYDSIYLKCQKEANP